MFKIDFGCLNRLIEKSTNHTIPTCRLSSDRSGCVECGLSSALDVLGGEGGAVVLLSGSAGSDEKERVFEIGKRLRAAAAPVYHIFFDQMSGAAPGAAGGFGKSYLVSASRMQKDTLLQRLSSVLREILGSIGGPRIVSSHQRFISWNGQRSRDVIVTRHVINQSNDSLI